MMLRQAALKDLAGGIVVLAIAGLYYAALGGIAESTLSDEVGATGLPRILAYVLAGLGILLTGRAVMAGALSPPAEPVVAAAPGADEDAISPLPRALGFLAFGAAYVVLVPIIGYMLAIALLIGSVALYEGAPRNWKTAAIALGGALAYWAIFVKILGVRQLSGWFF